MPLGHDGTLYMLAFDHRGSAAAQAIAENYLHFVHVYEREKVA